MFEELHDEADRIGEEMKDSRAFDPENVDVCVRRAHKGLSEAESLTVPEALVVLAEMKGEWTIYSHRPENDAEEAFGSMFSAVLGGAVSPY